MSKRHKRQKAGSGKPSGTLKRKDRSRVTVSRQRSRQRAPHWTRLTPAEKQERTHALVFLRLQRGGMSSVDAEKAAEIGAATARYYLPRAFYRDSSGHFQPTGYDRYVEPLQLPTAQPGKLRVVHARGSRQRSLCGQWSNALKAAGGGDFGPIDAFPKNVLIDGYHLATDHDEVQRILEAQAESDSPLEELYALTGVA